MEIKAGDILFLDTNILLAATDQSRKQHHESLHLFFVAVRYGVQLATSGQILREYLVVATRPPKINGLGLSSDHALGNISEFSRRLVFYEETESVSRRLRELIKRHALKGRRIHDANVLAIMLTHGLTLLVTDNPDDFRWCPDIQVVSAGDLKNHIMPGGGG